MAIQALLQKMGGREDPIYIHRYKRGATYNGAVFNAEIDRVFPLYGCTIMPIQFDTDLPDVVISPGNHTRSTDMVKIFTTEPLLKDDPVSGQKADLIDVDGVFYEVRASALLRHRSLGHWESICVRTDT